jgi:hypothetical protein
MLLSSLKVALIVVAWIALPFVAEAQSGPADNQPTGDVWISPRAQYLYRPRSGVTTSAKPELLLGDVWFTPNDADGNDGRKAPQDKSTETAVVKDVDHSK